MLKTLAQYLAENGGNHEAALAAMHADLTTQHQATEREAGTNIRARVIAKHLQPLADALGIKLPEAGTRPTEDATSALQDAVQAAIDEIGDLEDGLESWQQIAADAGLDVEAVLNEQDPTKAEQMVTDFLGGLTGAKEGQATAEQQLAAYQFAHANGLNPDAVLLQKGIEGLTLRDVEVTGQDGKKTTQKVWQVPGKTAGEYVSAVEYLQPVMGALKTQQQPEGTGWVTGQQGRSQGTGGSLYDQYLRDQQAKQQQQAAAAAGTDPLQMQPTTPTTTPTTPTQGGA